MRDPDSFMKKTAVIVLATLFLAACQTTGPDDPDKKAKQGANIGAAVGAIAGAIIGHQTGDSRTGAVIGAAAGAVIGGQIGHNMDEQEKQLHEIPNIAVSRPAQGEITVELPSDVLFDYNSAELRPESLATLRDVAANLSRYTNERVDVEGYTDATGAERSNEDLSQRRADAVANYLIDHGVLARNIFSRGWGATHPKATNDTPEGRQMNRRVEIHIRAQ